MSVPQSSRDRAEALRATLHAHNHRYYVLDDPQVSDAAYDALCRELQPLARDFPELLTADSPTPRVRAAPLKMFAAVHHCQRRRGVSRIIVYVVGELSGDGITEK